MDKKFGAYALLCAFGRIFTGLITVAMMPLYLPLLGKEAFGLFGIFVSIELIFIIFEGGLGNILVKDFASSEARKESIIEKVRAFECIYVIFGIVQTIICYLIIKAGAFSFLKVEELTSEVVMLSLVILSSRFAVSTVSIIHVAVITARDQMISLNLVRLFHSVFSSVGAYIVLRIYDGNPIAFFSWWVMVSVFSGIIKVAICWQYEFKTFIKARIRLNIIKPYFRDQGSLIILGILTFLSTQYPVWIIGIKMPLPTLGLYALALRITGTLCASLEAMTRPMMSRYAVKQQVSNEGASILKMMSEVLIIVGLLSATFYLAMADKLVLMWLGSDSFDPKQVSAISSILLFSRVLNLINKPYVDALLAERKFKLLYLLKSCIAVIGCSITFILIPIFGILGVAYATLITLSASLVFMPYFLIALNAKKDGVHLLKNGTRMLIICSLSYLILITAIRVYPNYLLDIVFSILLFGISLSVSLFLWYKGNNFMKVTQ